MTRTKRSLKKWKLDEFTLQQEGPNRWRVNGKDMSGHRRRIRFSAINFPEAVSKAGELLKKPDNESHRGSPVIQIHEAFLSSAKDRNWTEAYCEHDSRITRFFLEWCDEKGLSYWHELRHDLVASYQKKLADQGLSPQTIIHYLKPIRRASRWVAANWPRHYQDIAAYLRVYRNGNRRRIYDGRSGNPVLSIHELLELLDWLARKKPCECKGRCGCVKRQQLCERLLPGVALQGLCGLSILEVLRLTWDRVNLEEETITIDGYVKNDFRVRRIPIASIVVCLLRKSIRKESDYIMPDYREYRHYSHALRKVFHLWDPTKRIPAKDLRNTIQTAAIDGGWYGFYVQRYVGHAPTTTGERHYFGDQGDRLIPLFREKVVSKIEADIASWRPVEISSVLPGPKTCRSQGQ